MRGADAADPARNAGGADHPRFRPDVEGLRAVAVAMVLLYHTGVGWAGGGFAGVDVFFVISGFLITGLLLKECERSGGVSLLGFYARRAKRLLPAAMVVLAATALLAWRLFPENRWREAGGDIVASALYFINWRLAARSVDYLAEDSELSPVQHFWSLAVEEQYYIVWPLLLAAGFLLAKRWVAPRRIAWAALIAVGVPSFVWSVYLTGADQAQAYFVTTTRMWELAIGGLVAVAAGIWPKIKPSAAVAVGWAGLLAIVGSLLFQSTATAWPGYAAALPTVGTAAVIVAGFASGRYGPGALLGTAPMRWIGGLSYSLYLWHWPLIVMGAAYKGEPLSGMDMLIAVAVSVALAWITQRIIENPIRFSSTMAASPRFALSAGLNFSLLSAVAGIALILLASDRPATGTQPTALGARVLGSAPGSNGAGEPKDKVGWMVPDPRDALQDVPAVYADGCQGSVADDVPISCVYGDKTAEVTIAVVGDSKVAQWMPALEILARQNHWRLVTYTKSGCGFHPATLIVGGKPYRKCDAWNQKLIGKLTGENRPDFLITSQGRSSTGDTARGRADEAVVAGLADWWSRLRSAGVGVVALADNPHPGMKVYECVLENAERLSRCSFARHAGSGTAALKAAAARVDGVKFVDLTNAICPAARCAAVIGNVLVYRQGSHITKTYVESMADLLGAALKDAGLPGDALAEPAPSAGRAAESLPGGMRIPTQHRLREYQEQIVGDASVRHRAVFDFLEGSLDSNYRRTGETLRAAGYVPVRPRRSEHAIVITFRKDGAVPVRFEFHNGGAAAEASPGRVSVEWQDATSRLSR